MNCRLLLLVVLLALPLSSTLALPWQTVPLGGGGFVTGLVSDPTGADIYCRTDVGGAFKWDAANGKWNSITDLIISSTNANASSLMGIPGIAVDPNNTNKIYVAAGGTPSTSTPHGIFASSDKGAHWTQINSSILMHGNGGYRTCGERLQVDPNNSSLLWFGSTQDGLQKGVLSSGTWSWTQVPSTSVPFGQVPPYDANGNPNHKAGVTFVACDKNAGSTIVYAGVYDSVGSGSTGGVYVTTDGTNWGKVEGISMTRPSRGQVAPNGTLYVTQSGTVGKLLRGGTLAAITPDTTTSYSYKGMAIDPNDKTGNTLYVAEASSAQYNRIWRTVTGGTGATPWVLQYRNFNNLNYARTEPDGMPCVTGYWFGSISSILVSATNSNELWVGDYFGVTRTQNAQNFGTTNGCFWYMLQKNQEETCVEYLLNAPSGPRLMVGQGDVGGYRYLDTSVRPSGAGGSTFSTLTGGSNPGLDFCEANNSVWARTWLPGSQNGGSGAVSNDGGVTWLPFGEITNKTVVNSGTAGWESWDVSTYLAKQQAKGAKAVTLVLVSGNTPNYSANTLSFNSQQATNTTVRPLLVVNGTANAPLLADSYVTGSNSSSNFGSDPTLRVSYAYGTAAYSRWSYLKFDLSAVGPVTTGTLKLNRLAASNTTQFPVHVYACTNTSWVESTITWGNKPVLLAGTSDPIGDPRYYDGPTFLHGGRIAISATNPDIMVWLAQYPVDNVTSTGPRYSNDRGASWTASTGGPNSQNKMRDNPSNLLNQLASDRVNGKFYIANFVGASGGSHTVYSSTNGGVTFVLTGTCSTGSYNMYRAQLKTAPAADDVWICDDGSCTIPPGGGVWRSTNAGAKWAKVANGVINQVREVSFGKALSGTGYTVFINGYKNGIQGIYRSDNYGTTWVALDQVPTCADIQALAGDRQEYGKVYIGTGGRGVFSSALPPYYTVSVSADPLSSGSTNGAGIYQSGSNITLTAVPASGYGFAAWTESGTSVSTSTNYVFSVSGPRTLVANFQPATVATWKGINFVTSEQPNSLISGNLADPDGDGCANLLEYALGMKPKTADRPSQLQQQIVNGYLTLTYTRSKTPADLTYTVEVSSDLKTWTSGTSYTTAPVVTLDTGFTQTVQVADCTPFSTAVPRFIRLRVTAP